MGAADSQLLSLSFSAESKRLVVGTYAGILLVLECITS